MRRMKVRFFVAIGVLMLATAAAHAAQPAAANFAAKASKTSFDVNHIFQDAIVVTATDAAGAGVAGVEFEILVKTGKIKIFPDLASAVGTELKNQKTGANGTKKVSIETGDKGDVFLVIVPHDSDDERDVLKAVNLTIKVEPAAPAPAPAPTPTPTPAPTPAPADEPATDDEATPPAGTETAETPAPPAVKRAYKYDDPELLRPNANQVGAIKLTVTSADEGHAAQPGVKVKAKLINPEGIEIYSDTTKVPGAEAETKTDAKGLATFSIQTDSDHPANTDLLVTPMKSDTESDEVGVKVLNLTAAPRNLQSLGSKLSYLQLFTGATFANSYDANGESEGFTNAGPIIRLTFDTMWKHQRAKNPRFSICSDPSVSAAVKMAAGCSRDARCSSRDPRVRRQATGCNDYPAICSASSISEEKRRKAGCDVVPNPHAWADGAWHTDLNFEFVKFPVGILEDPPAGSNAHLENSFTGTFGATWQPNRWSHYDRRDSDAVIKNFDFAPFDAYRWELFGKAGVTTLTHLRKSGDSAVDRMQLGARFTHRRSFQQDASHEDRNLEPIRFVEISGALFSGWGDKHAVPRLVIDGGLRLGALSNDVFPVYLGAHLNTGPGPDDVRMFIGVLMKLDKLANLVRNAGVATGE